MSRFFKDANYGRIGVQGTPFRGTGKIFIVGDSSTVNLSMLRELWTPDQDGAVRYFATIDAAVGACTADAGDIIYVMPGHTETISAAGSLALDVAGISVIGIGNGSNRPVLNYTTAAAASVTVGAANILVENCRFTAGFADITVAVDVGTAAEFTLRNCEFTEPTTDQNFLIGVRTNATANSADGLRIENCRYIVTDVLDTNFVYFRNNCARPTIINNWIKMGVNDSETIIRVNTGNSLTDQLITNNFVRRLQTTSEYITDDVDGIFVGGNTQTNTGIIALNYVQHSDITTAVLVSLGGVGMFENYGVQNTTANGILRPLAAGNG